MRIDFPTLLGLGGTVAVVVVAITLGDGETRFFDPASFLLVLGGTLTAVLSRRSLADFVGHVRALSIIGRYPVHDRQRLASRVQQWAAIARRDGTLALEQHIDAKDPPFLRDALTLVVDGANEDALRQGLQARLAAMQARHRRIIATWEDWLVVAPAMGMIGTLIGLVQMLGTMRDPAQVGHAMALALLTTLYGAFLANVIAAPVASKLQLKHVEEIEWCESIIASLERIVRGESPRRVAGAVVTPFPLQQKRRPEEAA
jgi:chemotaxis protein MotA